MTATTDDAPSAGGAPPGGDLATPPGEVQRIDPEMLAAVTLAFDLIDHGVPVVVCPPNPAWYPGAHCADVLPPPGWSTITAEDSRARLRKFRPGVDTLAMVGGHGVDAVDVDPKNGGADTKPPRFPPPGKDPTPAGG